MSTAHLPEVEVGALWAALEQAADLAGLGVFVARIDSSPPHVLYASHLAAKLIGRGEAKDLVGMVPWVILRAEDQPKIAQMVARPAGAPPASIEVQIERPDGSLLPIALTTTRMITASATLTFGYFRDLSAERAAKLALERSEARFRALLEQAPDGVVVLLRGRIVFINPKAATLVANAPVEQLLGRPIVEYLPPEDARRAVENIQATIGTDRATPPTEYAVSGVPGRIIEITTVPMDWMGEAAIVAFARDVTERKAIQARLVEVDRLAALGKLAAAVAHEINNPLTYAQLTAQRLERALAEGLPADRAGPMREQIRDIEHGIARIASITAGLRSFARVDDEMPGPGETVAVGAASPAVGLDAPAPAAEVRRRVLVIDDEPLVRNVLAKLLADTHAVTIAATGADGLAVLATMMFDVIICDVMMPGMNGREVYRRIAAAHPGLERRMVFISGGTFAPDLERFLESTPNPKLAKPFRLDDVLKVVEHVAKSG